MKKQGSRVCLFMFWLLFATVGLVAQSPAHLAAAVADADGGLKQLVMQDRTRYGMPSDASDFYLEVPSDTIMDKEGRLYVLDFGAKTVFVWDRDGNYLTNLGREGQGPGEFTFRTKSRSLLSYDGEFVYVVDNSARKIHLFRDLTYVRTIARPQQFDMLNVMRHLKNGKVFLFYQNYRDKVPFSKVVIANHELEVEKELLHFEDKTFRRNEAGGWDYFAFSRRPLMYASYYFDAVLVGDSTSNELAVYDLDGNFQQKIVIDLPRRLLSDPEKDKIRELVRWAKPPHRIFFPEYNEPFTNFVPISSSRLFVYTNEYDRGRISGFIFDWQGRSLGEGTHVLGDDGSLDFFADQMIGIYTDAEGNYTIKAMAPTLQ